MVTCCVGDRARAAGAVPGRSAFQCPWAQGRLSPGAAAADHHAERDRPDCDGRSGNAGDGVNLLRTKVLEPFWQSVDHEVSEKMASVTLEHLLQNAEEAGMQRPSRAPISFSI